MTFWPIDGTLRQGWWPWLSAPRMGALTMTSRAARPGTGTLWPLPSARTTGTYLATKLTGWGPLISKTMRS